MAARAERIKKRVKHWILFYISAIVISGISAFFINSQAQYFSSIIESYPKLSLIAPNLTAWFVDTSHTIKIMHEHHAFIFYGTDWLGYAHIMIAILFIGPLIDPQKNIWVIHFGMICCFFIIPTAFIFGSIRGIPFLWQLIDCSFGVFGFFPLYIMNKNIKKMGSYLRRGI